MHNDTIQENKIEEVKDRDNLYVVEVELSLFCKEEIQISFYEGYLTVVAQKYCGEYLDQEFKKAYYIGKSVSQENIRAAFHGGVLKCMIPKGEKRKEDTPIQIEIM